MINISGNQIVISARDRDLVLVIDASNKDLIKLGQAVIGKIKPLLLRDDLAFHLYILSHDIERLDTLEELSLCEPEILKRRGRFITPLVENCFMDIENKKTDLLVIHSGTIIDYPDWEPLIITKFSQIYKEEIIAESDINKAFKRIEENIIPELFEKSIEDIELNFECGSIPLNYPDDLALRFNMGDGTFTLKWSGKKQNRINLPYSIKLKARSVNNNVGVVVTAGNKIKEGWLESVPFVKPKRKDIDERSMEIIKAHLLSLTKGYDSTLSKARKAWCPLCEKEEIFYRAFFCNTNDQFIVDSIDCLAKETNKFLYVDSDFNLFPSDKDMLETTEGEFTFLSTADKELKVFGLSTKNGVSEVIASCHVLPNLCNIDKSYILLWH
jgi:hypothetical protein